MSRKRPRTAKNTEQDGNIVSSDDNEEDISSSSSEESNAQSHSSRRLANESDSGESDSDSDPADESDTEMEKMVWQATKLHSNSTWEPQRKCSLTQYAKKTAKVAIEDPFHYFTCFFPRQLMDTVVQQTNLFARQELQKQSQQQSKRAPKNWKDTTPNEMYVFLGLVLGMAIEPRKGGYRSYWRKDVNGVCVGANYGRFMTLRRYIDLRRFLHFSDNSTDVPQDHPDYDKVKKFRPVLDTFNAQTKKFMSLGDTVSVDELMVKFYGRSFMKVFMANKPTRYGLKFWSANDPGSGYFFHVQPYTGKRPGDAVTTGLGTKVILDMVHECKLQQAL